MVAGGISESAFKGGRELERVTLASAAAPESFKCGLSNSILESMEYSDTEPAISNGQTYAVGGGGGRGREKRRGGALTQS